MRKIFWMIPCVALRCVFASSLWAAQAGLAAADWSVKSPHSLAANPPSDDAVIALEEKLTSEAGKLRVCSSHFADLRHSGNLSLVVATSDGRFCSLSIIDRTAHSFELYSVDLAHFSDGPEVDDLAGNGNLELIVDTDLTGYQGGTGPCVATWPVIYAWTGSGYADVSRQYKGYYEQKLESLKKQIAVLSSATEQVRAPAAAIPPSAPDVADADCIEAEAAKIERFLGISRDAGMTDAIKWANSDDPNEREFAADVLEDIGTPGAIEHLRTLSNDTNLEVASAAKTFLAPPVGPMPAYTIEREAVMPLAESPAK